MVVTPDRMEIVGFLFIDISITFSCLFCKALKVKGVCKHSNKEQCCTDYRQEGKLCLPCIGSFGKNCSGGACAEGYYGHGCKERCNCSTNEVCNRMVGCQKIFVSRGTVTDTRIQNVVITTLSGCTLCLLIILIALVIRSKMSSNMHHQRENVINANADSQSYAPIENQAHFECELGTMNVGGYTENHLECNDNYDVSSEQYIPANQFYHHMTMSKRDTVE